MERFEAQQSFYAIENTLFSILLKENQRDVVKVLIDKDLKALKEAWTVISNISLPLSSIPELQGKEHPKNVENVKGALLPLLMTYLHQLYLYYKSLLFQRVQKQGSKKLKDLLASNRPEIADLMFELARFVSEFKPSDHFTILYNVKMMDLAEEMNEEINDTI